MGRSLLGGVMVTGMGLVMMVVVVVIAATRWTVLVVEESFEVAARVAARPVQDVLVLLCRPHAALAVVLVPPPFELFR